MKLPPLIKELIADLEPFGLQWEIGLLLVAFALGWLVAARLKKAFPQSFLSTAVVLPGVASCVILVGQLALGNYEPVPLLRLVQAFTVTWLIVRSTVGLVLHVFPASPTLHILTNVSKWLIWLAAALYVLGLLGPLTDYLDTIKLPFGKPPISLQSVIEGVLSIIVTLIAALWLSAWLEGRLQRSEFGQMNLRIVLAKLLRACLLVVAVLVALSFAGIPITALGVFGGALGVGLGLGLQRLAANYVSGFVILLDGSIKVGDNIRVDSFEGQVTGIRTRYTLVRATNGRESIVPNETLVSTRVENLSLANNNVNATLIASAAYESDIDAALKIMVDAARAQERVLVTPEPFAVISEFGADGFGLTLSFWIKDPENGLLALRGALYHAIWQQFSAAGIEVPYPQRVVRTFGGDIAEQTAGENSDNQRAPERAASLTPAVTMATASQNPV